MRREWEIIYFAISGTGAKTCPEMTACGTFAIDFVACF
jgi:hypothetical protein